MNMAALGSYLQTVRKHRKISQERLAEQIGTAALTIWRIENAKQEPGGELLFKIVAAIKANLDDVMRLVLEDNLTEDDGIQLAQAFINAPQREQLQRTAHAVPDERITQALDVLDDLERRNPNLVDEVIRYGRYLREQGNR